MRENEAGFFFLCTAPQLTTLVEQFSVSSAPSPCTLSTFVRRSNLKNKGTIHDRLHVILIGLSRDRCCVERAMVAAVMYGVSDAS